MRATVTIEDGILKELQAICQGEDYSEAIKRAILEYVTWKKWESILTFGNRFEWNNDVLPRFDMSRWKECMSRMNWETIITLGNRFEWNTDVLPRLDMSRWRGCMSRMSWDSLITFGNRFEWETDVLPRLDRFKSKRNGRKPR